LPEFVVGVDPEPLSLRAAEARARGYGLDPRQVAFIRTPSGHPLPFASESFDLVTCVSVLEFVPTNAERRRLVDEMKRVTRPGGHVFVATPSFFRVRETHSKRWLGNVLRREGYPWAMPPWTIHAHLADCERIPIEAWVASRALKRAGLSADTVPPAVLAALGWTIARTSEWQKVFVRKRGGPRLQ
jgi:SAM-dependent methyltransferase